MGGLSDSSLVATRVADALLVFVASPEYLAARGTPRRAAELARHDIVALTPEGAAPRWAVPERGEVLWVTLTPRVRVNHLGLARAAALEGLGIANLPFFACKEDVDRGRLRVVLAPRGVPFGGIFVVQPPRRLVTPRVRLFRELAAAHLKRRPELNEAPGGGGKTARSRAPATRNPRTPS